MAKTGINEKAENRTGSALALVALLMNAAAALCACIGTVISYSRYGAGTFMFYTVDSNLLAMIACGLCAVFILRARITGKAAPRWVGTLKYVSVCCLTVTALTVLFVLAPMQGAKGFYYMFFTGDTLYHHLLCPVIAVLSYLLFDARPVPAAKAASIAVIPTLIYAAVTVTLNIARVMEGPYPFLRVYDQPIWASCLWCAAILLGAYAIAFALAKVKSRDR